MPHRSATANMSEIELILKKNLKILIEETNERASISFDRQGNILLHKEGLNHNWFSRLIHC